MKKGFCLAKQAEDLELFRVATLEYFLDANHYAGFDCYFFYKTLVNNWGQRTRRITRLWAEEAALNWFKHWKTKLFGKTVNSGVSRVGRIQCKVESAVLSFSEHLRSLWSIYTLVNNHQEQGTPAETGKYYTEKSDT
jgi:hypothetical protein